MNADLSLEHQVALLPKEQQDEILKDLDLGALQYDWGWNARPSQKLSLTDHWTLALAMAGRGWGKTLCGAQWLRELDRNWDTLGRDPGKMRFFMLGRTAADVRDVMIEGPSGIMNIYPPSLRDQIIWTPTRRSLTLPNGSQGLVFSSEEPDQLRGPAAHIGWCLAEGTRIRTIGGQLPIEAIEAGDRVWTRSGLRPVLRSGATGVKQMYVLRTSDGRELRGSADHRIWTQRGWLSMQDVVLSDIVYAWTNQLQDRQPSLSGTESSGTAMPRTGTTGIPVVGHFSTSPSGLLPTVESPRDSRFTTSTTTEVTTVSTTSWLERSTVIAPTTQRCGLRMIPPGPSRFSQKHHEHGHEYSGRTVSLNLSSVETAASASSPSECVPSTAHLDALRPVAVVSVEKTLGWSRTYDLTVEGTSEYFAEDLLVHNSDEMASYKQIRSMAEGNLTAWENLRIAVRLGERPQILATTTPKRVPVLKSILGEAKDSPSKILLIRGKTLDNAKLSSGYLDTLMGLYGGTQLGKQELEGEMLDDVIGAMTSEQIIEAYRTDGVPKGIPWIKIVGVDPSVAEKPHDECGIVVVYISNTWPILKRHAFVVDDLSQRCSPTVWGDIVVKAAHEHGALVVAEVNQGANLVRQMVKQSAGAAGLQNPPIREVWSSKSKAVRSEPVGGAYSRGRVHHVNVLAELESQLTTWVPGESGYSPDRMDALVHACAAGMFPEALIHGSPGSVKLHNVASQRIPLTRQTNMPQRWGTR